MTPKHPRPTRIKWLRELRWFRWCITYGRATGSTWHPRLGFVKYGSYYDESIGGADL